MLNKIIKNFTISLEKREQSNIVNGEDIVLSAENKTNIIKTLHINCPELLHTKFAHLLISDISKNSQDLSNKQLLLLTKVIEKYNKLEIVETADIKKGISIFNNIYETIHDDKIPQLEKKMSHVANLSSLLIIAKLNPSTLREDSEVLLSKTKQLKMNIKEDLIEMEKEIHNIEEFSKNFQIVFKNMTQSLDKLEEYEIKLNNSYKMKLFN